MFLLTEMQTTKKVLIHMYVVRKAYLSDNPEEFEPLKCLQRESMLPLPSFRPPEWQHINKLQLAPIAKIALRDSDKNEI